MSILNAGKYLLMALASSSARGEASDEPLLDSDGVSEALLPVALLAPASKMHELSGGGGATARTIKGVCGGVWACGGVRGRSQRPAIPPVPRPVLSHLNLCCTTRADVEADEGNDSPLGCGARPVAPTSSGGTGQSPRSMLSRTNLCCAARAEVEADVGNDSPLGCGARPAAPTSNGGTGASPRSNSTAWVAPCSSTKGYKGLPTGMETCNPEMTLLPFTDTENLPCGDTKTSISSPQTRRPVSHLASKNS
mmetsp:Transcript_70309/g.177776  ORF Transcript_70309/g.177776 Transcript_70309/m.177776 type:complete len:251 (+) Transcript_70309:3-755(+)